MHDDVRLGGVLWFFAEGLLLLAGVLALFVVVDVWRRRRSGRFPEGADGTLMAFAISEAFFLFLMLVVQFTSLPPIFSAALLLLVPLAIGLGVAYLLRVVFPADRAVAVPSADGGADDPGLGGGRPRRGAEPEPSDDPFSDAEDTGTH